MNPLEALERGFGLFQSTFGLEAWRYYLGTAPLVLCFIPMWVVNGQIRLSNGALVVETVLLALAYVLRTRMVASYSQHVRECAFGVPKPQVSGALAQMAALGRLLAWKITLSAVVLVTLPSVAAPPWFYCASQFAALEAGEDVSERRSLRRCLGLAGQWYGAGFLLFLMCFPLWGAVWLNGFVVAIILPQLLHSIFGVNTLLSTEMGVFALFRSSAFWLSLFAGAWMALDPIVKCTLVVVYQHLRSRQEGDDLRGLLAQLPREQQKKSQLIARGKAVASATVGTPLLISAILLLVSPTMAAHVQQVSSSRGPAETVDSSHQARIETLRKAVHEESQRAIYQWHSAEQPSQPTWLDKLLAKAGRGFNRAWDALTNFLRKLWPRAPTLSTEKERGWQLKDMRLWLAVIAVVTLAVGAVLFWLRRRREDSEGATTVPVAALPNLSDAAVASERSEEEWFALGQRLEEQGELRLAVRAAYLGLLAGLAQREWLTIRRDRTNREYLDEFTRRWRRRPQAAIEAQGEISDKLRSSLRLFDRVWYGSHAVTPAAAVAYREGQRELLSHV